MFANFKNKLCSALALLVMLTATAFADDPPPTPEDLTKIKTANAECLSCHSEAGLKKLPKEGLDVKKLRNYLVDLDTYTGSDHGQMACSKCHGDGYDKHPHAAKAKEGLSECQDCHARKAMRIERQFDKSVHAENLSDSFTCATCHDAHVMTLASKLRDPHKIVAQDNKICLDCHDSDLAFAKIAPEKKKRPPIDEIHSWLPNTRLHWQAVRCIECHTPTEDKLSLSHEIQNKDKAEKKCATCHSANTSLNARLYRHLAKEEQNKYGFLNSVILSNSYVVGATRNPSIDWIVIGLFVATVLGVIGHGLVRIITTRMRRSKNHD
ncbi:MAG: hypothetical protein JSR69_05700 [Proteobacteria bacterium]|nr:hypothetical protein [Pseudomonadota bacterium]